MKGNISRQSFREGKRYSAVLQIQGGMVTDADLGEEATIARHRADQPRPRHGGQRRSGKRRHRRSCQPPEAGAGVVFAEGVRGVVRRPAANAPLALYTKQAGFPPRPRCR